MENRVLAYVYVMEAGEVTFSRLYLCKVETEILGGPPNLLVFYKKIWSKLKHTNLLILILFALIIIYGAGERVPLILKGGRKGTKMNSYIDGC